MKRLTVMMVLILLSILISSEGFAQEAVSNNCVQMSEITDKAIHNYAVAKAWDKNKDGKICGEELAQITEIEDYAFTKCDIFYHCACDVNLKSIDILSKFPNLVKIGKGAFAGCTELKKVDLPHVTEIGEGAFIHDDAIASLSLPKVEKIEQRAFEENISITELSLPSLVYLGVSAFSHCKHLKKISLPNVEMVETGAFYFNYDLEEAVLPKAQIIGGVAFYNDSKLKKVSFPIARSIGSETFKRCVNLEHVDIPNVESIDSRAFEACKSLKEINLPKVREISGEAFTMCNGMTKAYMPELEDFGFQMFFNCENLTEVYAPKAKHIYREALVYTKLKKLTVSSVNSIASHALACGPREEIILNTEDDIELEDEALSNFNDIRFCYYKFESKDTTLVLNCNKRPGGTGKPSANTDSKGVVNQWGGLTWKEIQFRSAEGGSCK